MTAVPTIEVAGAPRDALDAATLRALDPRALAATLAPRRWFGHKGGAPKLARITGVVRLPWGAAGAAITVVEFTLADGSTQRYQLPLTVRAGEPGPAPVARVEASAAGEAWLVDATEDAGFREALGAAFDDGGTRVEGDGLALVAEPVTEELNFPLGAGRLAGAEQSNTSMIFGDRAILKLYRRLEPGENPDVEIGRALTTRAHFAGVPALLGVLRLELPDGSATAGMVQRFAAGATDGWNFAMQQGRAYFADHGATAPRNAFVAEARKLGRLTAEMHGCLASVRDDPAFAPRPADRRDIERWVEDACASVGKGLALLEARLADDAVAAGSRAEAKALLGARDAYEEHVRRSGERLVGHAGRLVRHHGDYHLGQVLHTPDGRFLVIDFEGEPARPLAERRAPHSALRDVAGMLRSFAYMAATLERDAGPDADAHTRERHRIRAELWERAVRDAYLEAYLAAAPADVLPDSTDRIMALLALFETEKVFYELAYEVNNRPDWLWIPLRGIARLPCR